MNKKTTKGLMLRSVEGMLMQVAQFMLQIVLARILIPEDFGIVAILNTFINLANTMVNSGLSAALLQKKNLKEIEICTVFYIEFGVAVVMYAILFCVSPFIAVFYENSMLTIYLRVFAIAVVLGGATSMQLTMSRYRLDFRVGLIASVAGVTVQAIAGITMALNGCGVWSLIIPQVLYYAVRGFALIVQVRWIPSWKFSFESFKSMFSYSWKLFAGWMIGTLYQDVFAWIIGKRFDSSTLGYYSKGNSIPSIVNRVVTQVTTSVMFPTIAKNQDDLVLVKKQTRLMMSVSAAIVFPVMAGVAGAAETIVRVLLTDKWLPSVPVIQIMSIPLALNVIGNANIQSYNAIGRSDLFLRLEMIKRGATIILVLICMNIDYHVMLASIGVGGIIALVINGEYNKKILNYSLKEYWLDVIPYLFFAGVLFIFVNKMNDLNINIYLRLMIQIITCVILFLAMVLSGLLPAYKNIRVAVWDILKRKKG